MVASNVCCRYSQNKKFPYVSKIAKLTEQETSQAYAGEQSKYMFSFSPCQVVRLQVEAS